MRRSGFSLLEVMLVIGIIGLTSGISVPLYRDYQIRNDLNIATEQVTQGLSRARLLSQAGESDASWGFYIPSGTIYKGTSYATRDPEFDEEYAMPSAITTNGLTEIAYSKVEGAPNETGAIVLTALNNEQRTVLIKVETESVAVVENDTITICHKPSGNQHTMTISEAAWPAHQGHGDTLGLCDDDEGGGASAAASSVGAVASSSIASQASSAGAASSSGGGTACEDRFSVASNGTITTNGTVDVTFKVLGSDITWGEGGPEIAVTLKRKKLTGNSWQSLFNGKDVDGGETETASYTNGKKVIVRVNGYYKQSKWLTFDETYDSNDNSGHIIVLRDGSSLPDFPAFDDQDDLSSYLQEVVNAQGKIDIGTYDLVMLVELGDVGSSAADFQDAVILVQFAQPSSCD